MIWIKNQRDWNHDRGSIKKKSSDGSGDPAEIFKIIQGKANKEIGTKYTWGWDFIRFSLLLNAERTGQDKTDDF